jgi:hypothetical protein
MRPSVLSVSSVRPSRPSVCHSRPSVTSDKVRVRPIRINVLLTLDRVNLELRCPRWLPYRCHMAATWLPRWMVGVAVGAYGWLRGANVCAPPPRPFAPPTHARNAGVEIHLTFECAMSTYSINEG